MKDTDVHLLREDGWSLEVLNTLCSLGYDLVEYDSSSCVAHFSCEGSDPHGFELHRQDHVSKIRSMIYEAGRFSHEKEVGDAIRTISRLGGIIK